MHIYTLVLGKKKETKLESNYETKERRKRILNGLGN